MGSQTAFIEFYTRANHSNASNASRAWFHKGSNANSFVAECRVFGEQFEHEHEVNLPAVNSKGAIRIHVNLRW